MPAIPPSVLNTVTYLYPSREDAKAGRNFGGSGFLVGVPSNTHPCFSHVYLVSNYHVAVRGGSSVVRLNRLDGGIDILESDSSEWEFIAGGGDVAILPVQPDPETHDYKVIDVDNLLNRHHASLICVGEDVFMVGRFIDHDGGQTNKPAVRFGNISIEPSYLKGVANSDERTTYYCLDMHSRSGFSGAPVWAYRTSGSNLNDALIGGEAVPEHRPVLSLLGIHCGQFPEEMRLVSGDTSSPIIGYSGMTYALPAWMILRLLSSPRFMQQRALIDAQWK